MLFPGRHHNDGKHGGGCILRVLATPIPSAPSSSSKYGKLFKHLIPFILWYRLYRIRQHILRFSSTSANHDIHACVDGQLAPCTAPWTVFRGKSGVENIVSILISVRKVVLIEKRNFPQSRINPVSQEIQITRDEVMAPEFIVYPARAGYPVMMRPG